MDTQELRELARAFGYEVARYGTRGFLFDGNDHLRIRTFNSVSNVRLHVEGRVLGSDGQVSVFGEPHVPNIDRTEATRLFTVPPGVLLNASIRASTGSPQHGRTFATLEVVRGRTGAIEVVGALLADYVTDTQRVFWPGSPRKNSIEGPGWIRSVTGTNPAAGAEWSETVPTNARWRLHALSVELVTSVTVATRRVSIVVDDGAAILYRADAEAGQDASLTRRYGYPNVMVYNVAIAAAISLPGPFALPLLAGGRLRSLTTNLQAGDDFGAPQLLVEEWIED